MYTSVFMTTLWRLLLPISLWFVGSSNAATCYEKGDFQKSSWPHCFKAAEDVLAYSGKSGNQMKLGMWAEGHTGAWSSLAMAGNGGMKGAREIVVRKNSNGDWTAEDRYSTAYAMPALSSSQDVKLVRAAEVNGGTAWEVLLPLNACKGDVDGLPSNYPLDQDVNRWMLWALGGSHTFSYHGKKKGAFHANLLSGFKPQPSAAGLQNVTLSMPNVAVVIGSEGTDAKNPYVCGLFDLSKLFAGRDISKKHHVAHIDPHLNADSAKYVHHMILYGCHDGMAAQQGFQHNQVIADCESMPRGCYEMKYPWAVGSQPVSFPADVGMPFGQGRKWVALQVHYYNPSLDTKVSDSSGVTLSLTNSVRSIDAGVLDMNGGTSDDQRSPMPKGQKNVQLDFFMPKGCTNQFAAPHINIIGTVYHAHLLGTRINIDVLHEGAHAGVIRTENHYDFNHQSLEEGPVKKIYKGDEMKMTCQYNTQSRSSDVRFGDLTQTEMCWAAMLYYPLQDMTSITYNKWGVECYRYDDRVTETAYTVPTCIKVGCSKDLCIGGTTGTNGNTASAGTTGTTGNTASAGTTGTDGNTASAASRTQGSALLVSLAISLHSLAASSS